MEEKEKNFNFWPSFADLMIGLVLILVFLFSIFVFILPLYTNPQALIFITKDLENNEKKLGGVKVELVQEGEIKYSNYSNEEGACIIEKVEQGKYIIEAVLNGYKNDEMEIVINENSEDNPIDIFLTKEEIVTKEPFIDNPLDLEDIPSIQNNVVTSIHDYIIGLNKGIITRTTTEEGDYTIDELIKINDNSLYLKSINYGNYQKLMFSNLILFDRSQAVLSEEGKKILNIISIIIKEPDVKPRIQQIQIHGHADTDQNPGYPNIELAFDRAYSVFKYFTEVLGIDPAEYLISATSYGEYNSVQRSEDIDQIYNMNRLVKEDNNNQKLKDNNRRIEILIFYKKEK